MAAAGRKGREAFLNGQLHGVDTESALVLERLVSTKLE
jgi:hypothetical protein